MRPQHKVADILEMEQLQLKNLSLTSWHYRALQAIRRCRTKAMGGHIDKCDCCHELHISYNPARAGQEQTLPPEASGSGAQTRRVD